MKIYPALFMLPLAGVANAPVRGQDAKLSSATVQIQERIQKSGADVGVAFRTLDGKTEWYFRADEPFHAGSTMKVPGDFEGVQVEEAVFALLHGLWR